MGIGAFKKLSELGSGLFATHGAPIAIDFGVGAMKVLQVSGESPSTLVAAAALETPFELRSDHARRLAFQFEALPKLIKGGGFRGRRAVCAIPMWQTFCKHVQIAKTDGVAMADLVAGAVSGQLQCDPGALVYRHVEVEGAASGGRVEVICMASPRESVRKLLEGLKASKLEPVGMQSEFAAALRSVEGVSRRSEDQGRTTMFLDIGCGSTKVMIAHGSSMVFARTVEVGGKLFDETIIRQTKCVPSEALVVRRTMTEPCPAQRPAAPAANSPIPGLAVLAAGMKSAGVEPAAAVVERPVNQPDLSEPLEILTDELQMSLRYHDAMFPGRRVDRLVFMGGESRVTSVCQHVARSLKLQAQLADPLARVARSGSEPVSGVDFKEPQPGWSVALGLALSPTDL